MIDLAIASERSTPIIYNLWRHCYTLRQAAAHEADKACNGTFQVYQQYREIPWIKLLTDRETTKTFQYDVLDIIQYQNAWAKYGNTDLKY